jgi:hypothetical protein
MLITCIRIEHADELTARRISDAALQVLGQHASHFAAGIVYTAKRA